MNWFIKQYQSNKRNGATPITAQVYDGEAGQYYLQAVFYNPVTRRLLQEVKYREDGLNLSAYCVNNPVKYYDPRGYLSLCPGERHFREMVMGMLRLVNLKMRRLLIKVL